MVIQGEQDELVNQSHGRKLAATLPHARLVMLYGGHMQPYDHPAAIAAAVRASRRHCRERRLRTDHADRRALRRHVRGDRHELG